MTLAEMLVLSAEPSAPARIPTSRLTRPVLRLLLSEKTHSIPATKAEIVDALGWFRVFDIDPRHLSELERRARNNT